MVHRVQSAQAGFGWLFVALMAVVCGCVQPNFHRECAVNSECPAPQVCRFSNCVFLTEDEGCTPTDDPTEICDLVDNDCDGALNEADPDFDLGSCGQEPNARIDGCVDGACVFVCEAGFVDANSDLGAGGDGCECAGSPESCAERECEGGQEPQTLVELCPELTGAVAALCAEGRCQYRCLDEDGFRDVNQDIGQGSGGDGCECQLSDPPIEVCDGVDNDCDGLVDGEDDGGALRFCPLQEGVCALSGVGCAQEPTPEACVLAYQATAEGFDGRFEPERESRCDGLDNNCDGQIDEPCCVPGLEPILQPFANDLEGLRVGQVALAQGSLGRSLLVAHLSDGSFHAAIMDDRGQALSPLRVIAEPGTIASGALRRLEVLWVGERFVVLWQAFGAPRLNLQTVNVSGVALGAQPTVLTLGVGLVVGESAFRTDDFGDGSGFVIVFGADPARVFVLDAFGEVEREVELDPGERGEFSVQDVAVDGQDIFVAGSLVQRDGLNDPVENFVIRVRDVGGRLLETHRDVLPGQDNFNQNHAKGVFVLPVEDGLDVFELQRERFNGPVSLQRRRLDRELNALEPTEVLAQLDSDAPALIAVEPMSATSQGPLLGLIERASVDEPGQLFLGTLDPVGANPGPRFERLEGDVTGSDGVLVLAPHTHGALTAWGAPAPQTPGLNVAISNDAAQFLCLP